MSAEPRPRHLAALALALAAGLAGAPVARAAPPDRDGLSGVLRGVPPLTHLSPDAVAAAWDAVKAIGSPPAQLHALRDKALDTVVCTDLVDVRALIRAKDAPFGFRDNVRGRSWGRPSLARLLLEAMRRLRAEFPDRTVSIGDVSQPGCGQLAYGTLVRHLTGDDAVTLVNRARIVLGRPTVIQTRPAAASDEDRDDDGDFAAGAPTELEQIIVGQDRSASGELLVRVAERRLRPLDPPDADAVARFATEVRRLAQARLRADERRTVSVGADGHPVDRWVTHYVDAAAGRQLVAITAARITRRLDLDRAIELRLSPWYASKPDAYRGEIRWRRVAFPGAPARWQRWRQVYEAGHVSHHGGRDVDLSYLNRDNGRHFTVDPGAMDVAATWRWFELLDATGRDLGTPVEMILVDPAIKRHLAANLPAAARKSRLWSRIVRLAAGHDGHHHVRIAPASGRGEATARRALDGATGATGAHSERRRASHAAR